MDTQQKKENSFVLLIVIQLILTVSGLIGEVLTVIDGIADAGVTTWISDIFVTAVYATSLYYCIAGYKIPHGNLMRYIMVLFAFSLGMTSVNIDAETVIGVYALVICAVIVAYVSGRLDKIESNRILIAIVVLLLAVRCLVAAFVPSSLVLYLSDKNVSAAVVPQVELSAALIFRTCNQLIQFCSLALGYIVRYKGHADSGK